MNASLNFNRKQLKNGKRKPFTKMNGRSGKIQTYKPYSLPKLQPHILRRIRRKVKKGNQKLFIKKLLIAIVVLMLLLFWLTQL